jgi:hypothetical protein
LVLHRDMILDIPIIADLTALREQRQTRIDENLRRENRRRISFDYQPGQRVLLRSYKPNKMRERNRGPFMITRVHTNGTITIQRQPHVAERFNISLRVLDSLRRSSFEEAECSS